MASASDSPDGSWPSVSSVKEIDPPVDTALVITPSGQALKVVQDCAEAGVRRIWLYRAIGRGSVDQAAVDYCDSKRISVIPGECPFMFFRDSGFIHRFHGMVKKLTGTFPA